MCFALPKPVLLIMDSCRCDVCDGSQDDGRKTVSEQGRTAYHIKGNCADISSRALEANKHGVHMKLDKRTPCEKNLSKTERTTSAEDTQNQHYQRVRTVVDSFLELLLVLRSVDMAGVHTPPRFEIPHRNTDTHQQVLINFT